MTFSSLQGLFCHVSYSHSTTKQIPRGLLSQVLIPITEDNIDHPVLCSFVAAGKVLDPEQPREGETFSFQQHKSSNLNLKEGRL